MNRYFDMQIYNLFVQITCPSVGLNYFYEITELGAAAPQKSSFLKLFKW